MYICKVALEEAKNRYLSMGTQMFSFHMLSFFLYALVYLGDLSNLKCFVCIVSLEMSSEEARKRYLSMGTQMFSFHMFSFFLSVLVYLGDLSNLKYFVQLLWRCQVKKQGTDISVYRNIDALFSYVFLLSVCCSLLRISV